MRRARLLSIGDPFGVTRDAKSLFRRLRGPPCGESLTHRLRAQSNTSPPAMPPFPTPAEPNDCRPSPATPRLQRSRMAVGNERAEMQRSACERKAATSRRTPKESPHAKRVGAYRKIG